MRGWIILGAGIGLLYYLATETDKLDVKKALHRGEVTVDGQVIKDGSFKLNESQQVCLDGEPISLIGPRFIMLHKPADTL